ncbi:MAG: SIR2 family protein [Desulfarculaceae bacterium]|nr:SIR2 family protein [Desulfarculaceae bacterium]
MNFADPYKSLNYIQQCLSNNKKPLGIFLGAGCPVAIKIDADEEVSLIPDISGMTLTIKDKLAKCKDWEPLAKVLEEHFDEDGRESTTVEYMLTHIRALRSVAGRDIVRGLSEEELDNLDDQICQLIQGIVDRHLPDTTTPYHCLASWVDAVERKYPVEFFTTNYDLLMEQAFEDSGVPYFDGFAGALRPFFDLRAMEEDILPPRWARLWKLHGSVNWYQIEGKGVFRGTTLESGYYRRVIHPSHLKYQESRRMPYLAMIDRLRAFLKQPTSMLIMCGYSFRDEHINEVVVQGLQCTQTAVAFALLHGSIANYPQAVSLAKKQLNLNLLAHDGAVISGQESQWPIKESGSISVDDTNWIRWTPVDPEDESTKLKAEFMLGDFALFGQFLYELVGNSRDLTEHNDA